MLVINSFDFSLNGLNSSILFKSSINESRFGCFSNSWISLFTISLRLESSFWTAEWGIPWAFCNQHYRDEFPRTSRFVRFDGRRMFLLRNETDPDVHDANSAWVRLAVFLGIGILCNRNPLQSSCIPFSQYKPQVKCWKKRLRGIVFDRTAILFSERISDCTNVPYFGEHSKYFCTPRFWVYPDRIELLPDIDWRTSGSRLWKTRTACPFWDFFNPLWMTECRSWAFPMW